MSAYGEMAFGAGLNATYGIINNILAAKREQVAREENFRLNELAAQNADARTRAIYADLQSPEALLRQYKEAGLSPSLMFGGGGVGGQTAAGAQGEGVSGVSPTTYGLSAMEAAQIGLINAQKEKTEAETSNISTDTDKKKAEINNIIQNTKNGGLIEVWQQIQNGLAQMELNLMGQYGEEQITTALKKQNAEIDNLAQMLRKLTAEGDIAEETKDEVVTYIEQKVVEQQADILLKRTQAKLAEANISLSNAQAKLLIEQCKYVSKYCKIEGDKVEVMRNRLEAEIQQWGVENGFRDKTLNLALAKIITDYVETNQTQFINTLMTLVKLGGKIPTKVTGLQ